MERYEEIEKSIITTYRKKIWCQFIKGVKEFDGEKEMICISVVRFNVLALQIYRTLYYV